MNNIFLSRLNIEYIMPTAFWILGVFFYQNFVPTGHEQKKYHLSMFGRNMILVKI